VIIFFPAVLFVVAFGTYGLLRLAGGPARTAGTLAWWSAQGGAVAFLLSVVIYQKPASFYTNFVMLPALLLFVCGLGCFVLTLTLAIVALFKRTATREALQALGLAVLTLLIAVLMIRWRAS
jgi:hypothetical protein